MRALIFKEWNDYKNVSTLGVKISRRLVGFAPFPSGGIQLQRAAEMCTNLESEHKQAPTRRFVICVQQFPLGVEETGT